ncbi:MAG TPA: hypothetical protein VM600_06365, partial [Actinomycetota bacterium]|nr:hypothetical protein [Actinomycetota bacterium]
MMKRILALGLVTILACALTPGAHAHEDCSWSMYGRDLGHSFAVEPECSDIDVLSAPSLRPKWFFKTPSPVTA